MGEFDSLSRKPDARYDFLVKHGWPADRCSKRKVDAQRDFLLDALCNGSIGSVEGQMFTDALKNMPKVHSVDEGASFAAYSAPAGVTVSYQSSEAGGGGGLGVGGGLQHPESAHIYIYVGAYSKPCAGDAHEDFQESESGF